MSFKCNNCNRAQPNGVKPIKVVVETRNVAYEETRKGKIPTGIEIVKEINLCVACNEI